MFFSVDPVFTSLGESVTYKTISRTYNIYGDATESENTSTITAIIITSPDPQRSPFPFSDVTNDTIIIYTKTQVYAGDKITWNSADWRINETKKVDEGLYASLCSKEVS